LIGKAALGIRNEDGVMNSSSTQICRPQDLTPLPNGSLLITDCDDRLKCAFRNVKLLLPLPPTMLATNQCRLAILITTRKNWLTALHPPVPHLHPIRARPFSFSTLRRMSTPHPSEQVSTAIRSKSQRLQETVKSGATTVLDQAQGFGG
jgi:hypothetical protein